MSYINSYIRRSIYKTQKFNQNIQNVNMRKENKTTLECHCVEVEGTCYFSSDQQNFWVIRTGSHSVFGGFRVCHLFNFLCRVPSVAYFSELYILDWPFCFLLRLFCSVFDNCRIPCNQSLVVAWGRGTRRNFGWFRTFIIPRPYYDSSHWNYFRKSSMKEVLK